MRGRDLVILLISLTIAAGLLYASGAQLDYINTQRKEMGLVINPPLENAPPSLVFATVAMGAFRGLVVDILWMRADKLKEEGQFFDAKQLAQWITKLQPRFAAVWEFHAWNMAYNISVAIPASQPDQRWQWVRNGYELLRDEGIPTNPKSIQLYHVTLSPGALRRLVFRPQVVVLRLPVVILSLSKDDGLMTQTAPFGKFPGPPSRMLSSPQSGHTRSQRSRLCRKVVHT